MGKRPRRSLDRRVLRVLWPVLQWSDTREAWVLRGVGRWIGPVLVERQRQLPVGRPARTDRFKPGTRNIERVSLRR